MAEGVGKVWWQLGQVCEVVLPWVEMAVGLVLIDCSGEMGATGVDFVRRLLTLLAGASLGERLLRHERLVGEDGGFVMELLRVWELRLERPAGV